MKAPEATRRLPSAPPAGGRPARHPGYCLLGFRLPLNSHPAKRAAAAPRQLPGELHEAPHIPGGSPLEPFCTFWALPEAPGNQIHDRLLLYMDFNGSGPPFELRCTCWILPVIWQLPSCSQAAPRQLSDQKGSARVCESCFSQLYGHCLPRAYAAMQIGSLPATDVAPRDTRKAPRSPRARFRPKRQLADSQEQFSLPERRVALAWCKKGSARVCGSSFSQTQNLVASFFAESR